MATLEQEVQNIKNLKFKGCLFNLVIYGKNTHDSHNFEKILAELIKKFPCIVMFVRLDTEHPDEIRMHVETDPHSGSHVLYFETGNNRIEEVPFLLLPIFFPDLPIYLLWGDDPTQENIIFPHIKQYASHLVFDSECTGDLHRFSEGMLKMIQKEKIGITDINWARIAGWRSILYQIFDSEERIAQLQQSSIIQITYNGGEDLKDQTQAIYLQAWLAGQLGWSFESFKIENNYKRFLYKKNGNGETTAIDLIPQINHDLPKEEILSFEATSKDLFFVFLRNFSTDQVTVHISSDEYCSMPFTLALPTLEKDRLIKEIFYKQTSQHYVNMLKTILQINPKGI